MLDKSFGASSPVIGLMMSGMSLTTAVVSSQLGRIHRRFSLGVIIKTAFVIYGLALILLPFMPSLWLLLLPVAIFGVAHGANILAMQTALAGLAPLEYRGAIMSLNATMLRVGQSVEPPLMAVVYTRGGLQTVFLFSAGLAAVAPLVALLSGRIAKDRSS